MGAASALLPCPGCYDWAVWLTVLSWQGCVRLVPGVQSNQSRCECLQLQTRGCTGRLYVPEEPCRQVRDQPR